MSRKKRLQDKAEKGKKAEQKKQAYATRIAAKKTKKKRVKKSIPEGRAYIQSNFNNTIVTVTDNVGGDILGTGSAGREGFRGSKKSTSYAASKAATSAIMHAKTYGLEKLHIFVKGVGTGRDAAIRSLAGAGVEVLSIKDVTPIPHNGPRARKARRV
jgi:small subunit ribosomal protein S11